MFSWWFFVVVLFLAPFFCFVLFLNLPAVIHSINFSGAL